MEELRNLELDDTAPMAGPSGGHPSTKVLFLLEEFKVHKAFILETQKRMTTFTIAAIAVATTLLTGSANFLFTADVKGGWQLAYVALFPSILLIVTMRLMTAHRAAIGSTAAYIVVGIEKELGVTGFESLIHETRRWVPTQEANDPIADAFHLLIAASFLVFLFGMGRIEPPATSLAFYVHVLPLALLYMVFLKTSRRFKTVIPPSVEEGLDNWSRAMASLRTAHARRAEKAV